MVSECPPLVEFPLSWPLEFEFAKYWPNLDFLFMELVDVDKGELYMTRESFQDCFWQFRILFEFIGGFDNECRDYEEKSTVST